VEIYNVLHDLPAEIVRDHLNRVLASGTFRKAKRQSRLLECLVNAALEKRYINEYAIGTEAFEMGTDFDPLENSIVRTTTRNLRIKLAKYYCSEGAAGSIRIVIPEGGHVLEFSSIKLSEAADGPDNTEASQAATVAAIAPMEPAVLAKLGERTYFRYRDEKVEALDTSITSRALASRYDCDPVSIGDQAFPVTILWQNRADLVNPDDILGALDSSTTEPLVSSPTLNVAEYAAARLFIKSIYTAGPIKYEGLEYCMTAIDLAGSLPRVDGRFGLYYDNILTQYAMEWELKKALKEHGNDALAPDRVGALPLRETVERGRNPLFDGTQRCTAMTVSMLMVFERREQGLWTIIQRRSRAVGLSAGMLHVVPAGMFEAKNKHEKWSVQSAVRREMLEEVYNEQEQQGDGIPGFEDHLLRKEPILFLSQLLKEGRAEFSVTGICCDLLNLRPEICTILFVRDAGLTETRAMQVNWEYEREGPAGRFGTPWNQVEIEMRKVRVGEMVPSGVACFELGRMWLRDRHGV
jgi:hypothetical protein